MRVACTEAYIGLVRKEDVLYEAGVTHDQRGKYTRAKGNIAPEKYNVAPDITRRGICLHNFDDLNALYFCYLLCVSNLYCLY